MSQKIIELVERITKVAEEYGAVRAYGGVGTVDSLKKLSQDYLHLMEQLKILVDPTQYWGASSQMAGQQQFQIQSQLAQMQSQHAAMMQQQMALPLTQKIFQDAYDRLRGLDVEPEPEDIEIEFSL